MAAVRKPKFKSSLEKDTAAILDDTLWEYEKSAYPYTLHRHYTPDFISEDEGTWIEVKGFFRKGDTGKYKAIREQYPDKRLIFIFHNWRKKIAKGAKSNMGMWAKRNGWEFIPLEELEQYDSALKSKIDESS